MVSLPLMAKLLEALPQTCRFIMLGDKDQLGSIEAGAVLESIGETDWVDVFSREHGAVLKELTGCTVATEATMEHPLQDCMVGLKKNYRFEEKSGIGSLSRAVRSGDVQTVLSLVDTGAEDHVSIRPLPSPQHMAQCLEPLVISGFQHYLKAEDPIHALDLFDTFRIVSPIREGPYGVTALNALVERILRRAGYILPDRDWYPGRPIMILRNDYQVQLFNGDVGIIFPDPAHHGDLRAFFVTADGEVRGFSPARLPEHESVFAMTVHNFTRPLREQRGMCSCGRTRAR